MCRACAADGGRAGRGLEAQRGLKLGVVRAGIARQHNMRLRSNIRALNLSSVSAIS
jgi:hypothetical protein